MRRILLSLLYCIAISLFLFACKKEVTSRTGTDTVPNTNAVHMKSDGKDCSTLAKLECGMLSFVDAAAYQEVYDCLEAAYEAHIDAFEAEHGTLSEDDYNDLAESLGFVDEQPLIDFEDAVGFQSYRSWYEGELGPFMEAGGDPESFGHPYLFSDEVAGALYNANGAIMIGGTIYLVDDQFRTWIFCSCDAYENYIANPAEYENYEGDDCTSMAKSDFEGSGFTCRDHWKNCFWEDIGNNRKVNQNLSFYFGPPSNIGWTVAQSEQRGFKKKFGKWRHHRIWMKVLVVGTQRTTECADKGPFSRDKGYRLRKNIWVNRGWNDHQTFVDGDIKGIFWYTFSGTSNSRILYHSYNGCY